jgi:uncharacterized protein with HEPN domain
MMDRRLTEYLRQMKIASQDAIDFVNTMSHEQFQSDLKTQRAVAMSLVIVAEAASRIEQKFPEFREAHPEIAWDDIRGMRNRIAHDYFVVNFDTIWDTVRSELPALVQRVSALAEGAL